MAEPGRSHRKGPPARWAPVLCHDRFVCSLGRANMDALRSNLADGIRKHGFRKWYERQLISSHGYLVLTFLCAIGVFAGAEVYDRTGPASERLFDVASMLMCAAFGAWALRRYLFLLMQAEHTANQAVCPQCDAYARLELTVEQPAGDEVQVCCRRCKHRWSILP